MTQLLQEKNTSGEADLGPSIQAQNAVVTW